MYPNFNRRAAEKARQLWSARPLFLDTETTGLDDRAEIVEICIIDFNAQVLLDTLVKPSRKIPLDARFVHGINDEMVNQAPTWLQIWPQVDAILKNRTVGIYNAEFDLRMMKQSHSMIGMPWRIPNSHFFCIMKLYSDYIGTSRWKKLEDAGRRCRLELP